MKTPISKIEQAVPKKDMRFYLQSAWLDVANRRLLASDGHICAIVPVEIEDGDTTGPVSVEVLKQARKAKSSSIKANDALVLDNGTSYPRPEGVEQGVKYPDVDKIIPTSTPAVIIGLNAALLLKLAEAINDSGLYGTNVKLHISGPTDAIKVTGNMENAIGIIMPIRI